MGLLVAVVVLGLLLSSAASVWSVTEQRERETQLLFVGDAFRMAISGYYAGAHQYPGSLGELLGDADSPVPRRFLRRLYFDPMTGAADWTLIHAPDGVGIIGVASSSRRVPIKRKGFSLVDAAFEDADCYCSWEFVYSPRGFFKRPPPGSVSFPPTPAQPTDTAAQALSTQ